MHFAKTHFLTLYLLLAAASAPAATIVLEDNTFNNSDWTPTVVEQTGTHTHFSTQAISGGNPGTYRRHSLIFGQTSSPSLTAITVANFGLLTFNPATSGAIQSIRFDFDIISLSRPENFPGAGRYRPYLAQNGRFFSTLTEFDAVSTSWTSFNFLSTSSFDWFPPLVSFGSGTVDFSSSGAPITFGYRVRYPISCRAGVSSCTGLTLESGIDNFKVTITTAESTSSEVPEPATLALFPTALLALHLYRRARTSFSR